MTTHRERAAEYADAALTLRTMVEALELRAAEELALAREQEIEHTALFHLTESGRAGAAPFDAGAAPVRVAA